MFKPINSKFKDEADWLIFDASTSCPAGRF